MSRADRIEALFGFGIYVGADNLADKDYVVAGLGFRIKRAFKIGDGIGEQDRIDFFGGFGLTIKLG